MDKTLTWFIFQQIALKNNYIVALYLRKQYLEHNGQQNLNVKICLTPYSCQSHGYKIAIDQLKTCVNICDICQLELLLPHQILTNPIVQQASTATTKQCTDGVDNVIIPYNLSLICMNCL